MVRFRWRTAAVYENAMENELQLTYHPLFLALKP